MKNFFLTTVMYEFLPCEMVEYILEKKKKKKIPNLHNILFAWQLLSVNDQEEILASVFLLENVSIAPSESLIFSRSNP